MPSGWGFLIERSEPIHQHFMFRRFRFLIILPVMLAGALAMCGPAAGASLDLGRVDEYKLKSFSEYFGQYFDVAKPEFDDKEFETKLRGEAADINTWLADSANWPAENKIKPEMYADAGWLFFYFANAGLPGAQEKSMEYLAKASKADPKNFMIPLKLARMAAAKGAERRADVIRFSEQALTADPAAAAKENLHHLLAEAYYDEGRFAKAYAEIKEQAKVNPDFDNTSNLIFAWDMYVERWGRIPEKIKLVTQADGTMRPEPDGGA